MADWADVNASRLSNQLSSALARAPALLLVTISAAAAAWLLKAFKFATCADHGCKAHFNPSVGETKGDVGQA